MLENPITVVPKCYKYAFGTLAHILCLPYVGGTVFFFFLEGGPNEISRGSGDRKNMDSGKRSLIGWLQLSKWQVVAYEKFMVKVTCTLKVSPPHYLHFLINCFWTIKSMFQQMEQLLICFSHT